MFLICLLSPAAVSADQTGGDFSGTRTLILTADSSDLNNFMTGGREYLDLKLRGSSPAWLTYSMRSQGRDVVLTLEFEFTSLEDYTEKLTQLLGRSPNVLSTYFNGTVLTEDFYPMEMTSFLSTALGLTESDTSWSLDALFSVTSNILVIGEQTYEFGSDPIRLSPEANGTIRLKELNVTTEESDDGILTRTLTIKTGSSGFDKAQWDTMLQRFRETGESSSHSDTTGQTASVTFQAADSASLAQLTGYCLNTAVTYAQTVTEVDGFTMTVHRTEYFLLEGLMAEEGTFTYSSTHPSTYQELTALSKQTTVSDLTVTATDQSCIQLCYQQTFGLSKIAIHTDYSDLFGKIQRTITLSAPADTTSYFHAQLKTELTKRMVRGTALEIYDEDGIRYYVLRFSAWFDADISEYTQSILGVSTYSRTDSWLPYGESSLEESISSTRLLSKMMPASQFEMTYRFSSLSSVTVNAESAQKDGSTVTFTDTKAEISYRHLHIGKLLPEIAAVVIILLAILIPILRLCRKLRSAPKKPQKATKAAKIPAEKPVEKPTESITEKPIVEPETPKQLEEPAAEEPTKEPKKAEAPRHDPNSPRFCTKCGAALKPGSRFCTACGNPTEPPE